MKFSALVVAVGSSWLFAADDKPAEAVQKELKKLEGTWTMVSGEVQGKKADPKTLRGITMTIKGTTCVNRVIDVVTGEDTLTIDPSKSPKAWLRISKDGKFKMAGIYKVDGDTLTVCEASGDKDVPKQFATRNKSDDRLYVYQRKKE